MNTGERIRDLRTKRGLSQGELAIKLGYKNRVSIHNMETNRHNVSFKVAEKLARALETTPEYILWGSTPEGIAQYYETFANIENELSFMDKLAKLLSEDTVAGQHKFTDEQLNSILQYARFIATSK